MARLREDPIEGDDWWFQEHERHRERAERGKIQTVDDLVRMVRR